MALGRQPTVREALEAAIDVRGLPAEYAARMQIGFHAARDYVPGPYAGRVYSFAPGRNRYSMGLPAISAGKTSSRASLKFAKSPAITRPCYVPRTAGSWHGNCRPRSITSRPTSRKQTPRDGLWRAIWSTSAAWLRTPESKPIARSGNPRGALQRCQQRCAHGAARDNERVATTEIDCANVVDAVENLGRMRPTRGLPLQDIAYSQLFLSFVGKCT